MTVLAAATTTTVSDTTTSSTPSPSPSPSSASPSSATATPTTSTFWAVDSSGERELDPQLKEAQRFALDECTEEGDGRQHDSIGGPLLILDGPILLRNLLTERQIESILREASKDGVWPRGLDDQKQQQEMNGEENGEEKDPAKGSSGPTTTTTTGEEEQTAHSSTPSAATPTSTANETAMAGESTTTVVEPRSYDGSTTTTTTTTTLQQQQQQQQQLLLLREAPHHYAWSNRGHVVLYMHNNNHWFVRTLTEEWGAIRGGLEAREWMNGGIPELDLDFLGSTGQEAADHPSMDLVRTVELHHYGPGGGLTTPGHRDTGSELTISVLLSDSRQVEGGDFVTYTDEGRPVAHRMDRGDAILFNSMSLHNISTVTAGLRKSLVVELWPADRCP